MIYAGILARDLAACANHCTTDAIEQIDSAAFDLAVRTARGELASWEQDQLPALTQAAKLLRRADNDLRAAFDAIDAVTYAQAEDRAAATCGPLLVADVVIEVLRALESP